MAKCEICEKDVLISKQTCYSKKTSSRTYKPNLQTVKTKDGNNTKKITVCTRCLKSGKVERAV